ncbi:MAG: LysR family transcriptional regulator [Opitutaceae bacterium]|jgi:LysR family hydrogen peroxide-inducible transcriptional activator
MELQQLRYVIAVAETGNFTRASERTNVSQPSLSQQIINLEKELGHKLFHRLGRKAVLTESGQVFLERARRVLFEVEDASREIRDSDALERSITVGAIPSLAPSLIPPLIALSRTHYPQLVVNVWEDFTDELSRGVVEGELDLAVVELPMKDPRIHSELLFSEPLLLAIGINHPLASRRVVVVDDIKNEKFIMLGGGSTLTTTVQRFCGDNQFKPIISCRCAQLSTAKSLVALGCGISILPKSALSLNDRTSIITKYLDGKSPTRDIGVIRHMQRYQSRGAEQFLTLLREHTKKPVAVGTGAEGV